MIAITVTPDNGLGEGLDGGVTLNEIGALTCDGTQLTCDGTALTCN